MYGYPNGPGQLVLIPQGEHLFVMRNHRETCARELHDD
jgi:hypothetical protein